MADDQTPQGLLEELGRRLDSLKTVRQNVADAIRVIGQTHRRLQRQIEMTGQADLSKLDGELKESIAEATRTLLRLTRMLLPDEKDLQVRPPRRVRQTRSGRGNSSRGRSNSSNQRSKKPSKFGISIAAGKVLRACFTGETIPQAIEDALARTWPADWSTRKTLGGVSYSEDIQRGDASLLRRELRAAMLNLQHVKDGTHPQGRENPAPMLTKLFQDIGAGTRWDEILQVMVVWGVIPGDSQEAA